jgi:hypothetical protein
LSASPIHGTLGTTQGEENKAFNKTKQQTGGKKESKHQTTATRRAEALVVHDARAALVVLLLLDPHGLEGGEGGEDGAADPHRVLALRWGNDFGLDRGGAKGADVLREALRKAHAEPLYPCSPLTFLSFLSAFFCCFVEFGFVDFNFFENNLSKLNNLKLICRRIAYPDLLNNIKFKVLIKKI